MQFFLILIVLVFLGLFVMLSLPLTDDDLIETKSTQQN